MDVNIGKLKTVAEILFRHLEENEVKVVTIPHDYYWQVPKEVRYDPYNQPKDLTLGQLSDDMTELERIVDKDTEPISFAFVWLANVLQSIGENTVT